jgi:hypothetical protein
LADFVLWRNGGPLQNDPTPGVQPEDYATWRANFGRTSGSSVASAAYVHDSPDVGSHFEAETVTAAATDAALPAFDSRTVPVDLRRHRTTGAFQRTSYRIAPRDAAFFDVAHHRSLVDWYASRAMTGRLDRRVEIRTPDIVQPPNEGEHDAAGDAVVDALDLAFAAI